MARLLGRAIAVVEWIEDMSGGVLLFIAATLVFVQIVLRILGLSFSGLYEIAAFCAVWSVFLTAGVGIQRNVHVRVDVLLMICPPPLAYVLRLLSALLMVGMSAVLCYSGYLLIDESLTFGDRTLGMISIPMWIPQIIMPLGGVLMLVHSLVHLMDVFHAGPRAAGTPDTPELSASAGNI